MYAQKDEIYKQYKNINNIKTSSPLDGGRDQLEKTFFLTFCVRLFNTVVVGQ